MADDIINPDDVVILEDPINDGNSPLTPIPTGPVIEETPEVEEDFDDCSINSTDDIDSGYITTSDITWANWDNLLSYIKLNFGSIVNAMEYSDEDLIEIISEHVLPEYSKYDSLKKYYIMTEEENVVSNSPMFTYQFLNFPYKILRVDGITRKPSTLDLSQFYNIQANGGDITNFLMTMNTVHMAADVVAIDTWQFRAPNKIEMITGSNNYGTSKDFIAHVACVHKDPSTVDPDTYNLLKDLALANILIYIGRIRTRFQSFNTPQAAIEIPAEALLQEGQQLKAEIIQKLDDLPPNSYIWWLN